MIGAEYLLSQSLAATTRADPTNRIRPANAWMSLCRLVSSQLAIKDLKKARRLVWSAVRFPATTLSWLTALERVRVRAGVETIPYRLARKASQKFLHHSLPRSATINLLTTHYERLLATLGAQFVGALLRDKVVVLGEIKSRSAARYRLCLGRVALNPREGELVVHLVQMQDNRRVASLTVVVGALHRGGAPDLWIGGLQGCQGPDSKAVTVQATRDLWGLRPKDLLIHVAYALHDVFDAANIKAISNAGHALRPTGLEKAGWHADYDAFWRELGGEPIPGDCFRLPKVRHRRSIEEVPSAKRNAWRARYALVDEMTATIRRLAIGHSPAPPQG